MENVFALGYRNQNRPVLERFIAGVQAAGYSFDMKVLVAADYGVPQLRQRLLCVGLRGGRARRSPLLIRVSMAGCDAFRPARDAHKL